MDKTSWFARNGDRLLNLCTISCTAILAADKLGAHTGLSATALVWVAIGSSILTGAHQIFFPSQESSKS